MKLTKKQKEEIIKEAIARLERHSLSGICWAITDSLRPGNSRFTPLPHAVIKKVFPRFKRETAVKYFHATDQSLWWWNETNVKIRVKFLQYLLDGKLPKKES